MRIHWAIPAAQTAIAIVERIDDPPLLPTFCRAPRRSLAECGKPLRRGIGKFDNPVGKSTRIARQAGHAAALEFGIKAGAGSDCGNDRAAGGHHVRQFRWQDEIGGFRNLRQKVEACEIQQVAKAIRRLEIVELHVSKPFRPSLEMRTVRAFAADDEYDVIARLQPAGRLDYEFQPLLVGDITRIQCYLAALQPPFPAIA